MSKNNRSTRAVQKLRNQLAQAHTALVAERKLNDRLDAECEALQLQRDELAAQVDMLTEQVDRDWQADWDRLLDIYQDTHDALEAALKARNCYRALAVTTLAVLAGWLMIAIGGTL